MSRFGAFIDAAYLNRLPNRTLVGEFDFDLLAERLSGGGKPEMIYYYDALPFLPAQPTRADVRRYQSKKRFFDDLSANPRIKVRLGVTRRQSDKYGNPQFKQKRVDTQCVADLTRLSIQGRVTHIALVTGDDDFLPAVREAHAEGVRVNLFHGPKADRDIIKECDHRTLITDDFIRSISLRKHSWDESDGPMFGDHSSLELECVAS